MHSSPESSMPADDERKHGRAGSAGDTSEREVRDSRLPLAELLRRGISAGQAVSESLFPRELASSLAAQLVDARHGLVNAIAVEVGRFLRQADIASEVRKVLAGLSVDAHIKLKFSETDQGSLQTDVRFGGTGGGSGAGGTARGARGGKSKSPGTHSDE